MREPRADGPDVGREVWYVDPDAERARRVATALEAADHEVTTAGTVDAIDPSARQPACVVTRARLPDGDAVAVCGTVDDGIPVVVYAGDGGAPVASRALVAGAADYVHDDETGDHGPLVERLDSLDAGPIPDLAEAVLEVIGDGVYVLDAEGRVAFVDERTCELTGYDRDELLGVHADVPFDAESVRRSEAAIETLLADPDREVATVEATAVRPDGDRRHVEVRLTLRRGPDGTFQGTVGVLRDVTERREREAELETYERMLNTVPDVVYALDAEGQLEAANDAARSVTGYGEGELVGEHTSATMREEDLERGSELIAELLSRGETEGTFEMALVTADGEEIPCENHMGLRLEDDAFVGTVGVLRDVSERKRHERTLRALHEATRELLQADTRQEVADAAMTAVTEVLEFPVTVVRLRDDEGDRLEALAASGATTELLGERPTYPAETGPPAEALEAGEAVVIEDLRAAGIDRGPVRRVMYVPIGDHGVVSIGSTEPGGFAPEARQYAEILSRNAAVVLDRVARRRELAERNARLDEFASFVSHDLRNPLNVAAGHLSLFHEDGDETHLDRVADAHDRMDRLVGDVLALARHGARDCTPDPVDLRRLATDAWQAVDTADAELVVVDDAVLSADPDHAQRLLENLVRNAVEHGGSDVTVTVGTLSDGFYVADDGPGIPPAEREAVTDVGVTTAPDGTGLGLTIVRRVADRHGWTVDLAESADGGARFEFHRVRTDEATGAY